MTKIEGDLLGLRRDIVRMGSMVADIVMHAVKAATRLDMKLARDTIAEDEDIDALRFELDDRLIQALAVHRPVGDDLRELVAAMRVCLDLERIGDLSVNVVKAVIKLQNVENVSMHPAIVQMGNACVDMLEGALEAYFARDTERARIVSKRDDEVDAWYKEVGQHFEKASPGRYPPVESIHNVLIARYIERMCDHTTNICEWVVFEKNGLHEELN